MSQAATRRKLELAEEQVRVEAKFLEQGSILAGTKRGSCEGIRIELILEGDQEAEAIAELIRVAHQMCFTEDVLVHGASLETVHTYNGNELKLEEDQDETSGL